MRIVSLLPSLTELVVALGKEGELVGVTHECDFPPGVEALPHLTRSRIPASATGAEIERLAVEAYRALDCEGWGRVDVLLRASDNKPFLIEVNASPGMTTHSLVPMAARAVGIGYEDLCVEILRSARLKMAKGQD